MIWWIIAGLVFIVFLWCIIHGSDVNSEFDDEEQLRAIQEWKERKINKDA